MIPDLFVGELAAELLRQLYQISRKCIMCKATADELIEMVSGLLPTIEEIKYSGVELPAHRQFQLDRFSELLKRGIELAQKVQKSPRWNVYRNLHLARKMDEFRKNVSKFVQGPMIAQAWADVHHLQTEQTVRFNDMERMLSSLSSLKVGEGGSVQPAATRSEPDVMMEEAQAADLGNLGVSLELGRRKVKEMLLASEGGRGIYGITGIGGSGKTTLAAYISRDREIQSHFNKKVLMLTVSQSPDLGLLQSKIRREFLSGNEMGNIGSLEWDFPLVPGHASRSLLILDDVWHQSTLELLASEVLGTPGLTILVVSRFKFQNLVATYQVQLLQDDEAVSLFCFSAFGQTTIPPGVDKDLVKQIVDECKGLPLALKVIGASLREQDEKCWESARKRLLRGEPISESHENKLLERLAVSVDYLNAKVRECFLDLGSFPEDKKVPLDVLTNMWVEIHELDPESAFAVIVELSNKNLLTLVRDARSGDMYTSYYDIFVTQHDVLRDLAIHLSNRGEVNKRKRLIMPKRDRGLPREWERNADQPFDAQIVSVDTEQMDEMDWFRMDFPKAEVLILNFSSNNYFLPPFIASMPRLRALIVINNTTEHAALRNSSVFTNLEKLRSIWLEKVQVPQLSDSTVPLKNLSKMSLVLCKISNSFYQAASVLPKIFPRLSELTIDHCDDLVELPSSICLMRSLGSLSVTNCPSLRRLPAELGHLTSLEVLRLYACPNLKTLPPGICELRSLKYLDLSQCVSLTGLPKCIGNLSNLRAIDMGECLQIMKLPDSVTSLRSLRRVICDEDILWQWKAVARVVPDLHVQPAEKRFGLDWLNE